MQSHPKEKEKKKEKERTHSCPIPTPTKTKREGGHQSILKVISMEKEVVNMEEVVKKGKEELEGGLVR